MEQSFKESRESVESEPHSRRPKTMTTDVNDDRLDEFIRNDRRITIWDTAFILNISVGNVDT